MEDVSLHSPVVRSFGPPGPADMGQYTYEDEEGGGTPRRIWPAEHSRPHRYAARTLAIRATAAAPATRSTISHNALALLTVVGLVIFTCSTASLVILAMLIDSTRGELSSAAKQITGLQETLDAALDQNKQQLARLLSLMSLWLDVFGVGNSTLAANVTGVRV